MVIVCLLAGFEAAAQISAVNRAGEVKVQSCPARSAVINSALSVFVSGLFKSDLTRLFSAVKVDLEI